MLCGHSFLEKCDPRAKLLSLFFIMPIVLSEPIDSWRWGVATALSILAMLSGLTSMLLSLFKQLYRLRWLFLTILFFHIYFTPGEPLWQGSGFITSQGLHEGLQQMLRLILLVSLSWSLVITTTPLQLIAGLYALFGGLERFGLPIKRGLAITAFALGRIPYFIQEAHWVKESRLLRMCNHQQPTWRDRLYQTAQAGETLLFRIFSTVHHQEEALLVRGFTHGLPFMVGPKKAFGWRDVLVVLLPIMLFLWKGLERMVGML